MNINHHQIFEQGKASFQVHYVASFSRLKIEDPTKGVLLLNQKLKHSLLI